MSNPVFVKNLTRLLPAPARVLYCESFLCRLRGLMFRRTLDPSEGLLLVERRDSVIDSSIHMLFVNFNLAVFWINSAGTVVDRVLAKSWRPAYASKAPARYILELHPDRWDDYLPGEQVEMVHA